MSVTFTLLRHGQIKANRQGHWHGSTDSGLTWKGRRQARKTGKHLAELPAFDAIYSSPLRRCVTTASLAARVTEDDITTLPGLAEMSIGEWEGQPFRWLSVEHDFVNQICTNPDFRAPGGESLNDVSVRVTQAFAQIDKNHDSGQRVLVASHGVALAIAMANFLASSPAKWTDYHFNNCSLTEFVLSPEPVILSFNQISHL